MSHDGRKAPNYRDELSSELRGRNVAPTTVSANEEQEQQGRREEDVMDVDPAIDYEGARDDAMDEIDEAIDWDEIDYGGDEDYDDMTPQEFTDRRNLSLVVGGIDMDEDIS